MSSFIKKLRGSFNVYDVLILASALLAAGLLAARLFIGGGGEGGAVRVSVYGEVTSEIKLSEDRVMEILPGVILEIYGGAARISQSACPDGLCVKQGSVSRGGQRIVCLPNGVVVEVYGAAGAEVDAVTR